MVIETLPQLAALSDDERETLALELLESVRERQRVERVSPELVAELEARRAEFLDRGEKAKTWTDVKATLLSKYRAR
jgi:hypothetical protein